MELQKIAHNVKVADVDADAAFLEYKTILYGSQLQLNTVVGKTNDLIDEAYLKEFSASSMRFIQATHGHKDSGFTLTVSINILIGTNIDPSAIKFAGKSSISQIGEREIPVVYDLILKKYYTFRWYNLWGFIYAYYYLRTIKKIISHLEKNEFNLFSKN